jgi:hypothetical protein
MAQNLSLCVLVVVTEVVVFTGGGETGKATGSVESVAGTMHCLFADGISVSAKPLLFCVVIDPLMNYFSCVRYIHETDDYHSSTMPEEIVQIHNTERESHRIRY